MPRFLDTNTSNSITSCSFLVAALAIQSETTRRVSQFEIMVKEIASATFAGWSKKQNNNCKCD